MYRLKSHLLCAGGHRLGVALTLAIATCNVAVAQTVYRCETKGKVSYSNEPCIGAKVVDTTPTQGLDKSSGVSRKGPDVQREQYKKSLNEALRPLTGMSHEESSVFARRHKLAASVNLECQWLDARLPAHEAAVKNADVQSREKAETELFLARSRFRNLGC